MDLTVEEYINRLPEDRKEAVSRIREEILENIPAGFEEVINYNMIGYVVPHSLYPAGYHASPELPLPFIHLASLKSHVALYHSGLYVDDNLMQWFLTEYKKSNLNKPDMGKSCLRFKKVTNIPYQLIGRLCSRITPEKWIQLYETQLMNKRKR